MDVKYIGGDVPWTLPFGDHFYSPSEISLNKSQINPNDLETIARRHGFEPFYSSSITAPTEDHLDSNLRWMNAGVFFTDKTIEVDRQSSQTTDFHDDHAHTFCYLCSINAHEHHRTQPRDPSRRRKLIPYNNPKALKARSTPVDRTPADSSDLIPYRFIVRTDSRNNSGTRAQVFLYMYGTENDWTSINLRARSDGFPTGSIRTFCLKGPDIGQLRHLNVNLVGARSEKAWFLKEIEITNLNTSVTWLCEFNCWLPKNETDKGGREEEEEKEYHVKPSIGRKPELTKENLSVYVLEVFTGGKPFAGTDSTIQVLIRGSDTKTRRLPLTSDRSNLFEQNQIDTFVIVGWDLGDLLEMTVESDVSQFASDWDLKEMVMWKIFPRKDYPGERVYFPFNQWLGKKTSRLKKERQDYPIKDRQWRGLICYHISVKTGTKFQAGTDANVFIQIFGESGRTTLHWLDNKLKNDFEAGSTSEFTIVDIDVGRILKIEIGHDNKNLGSAWFLDSVTIQKKYSSSRVVSESFVQRLQQLSEIYYRQSREKLRSAMRNHDDIDSTSQERPGSSRSILRSPTGADRASYQKKVTWEKNADRQERGSTKSLSSSITIDSGHFEHRAYWISSHHYVDKKWKIKSIEEHDKSLLDSSTRTSLLADRIASSSKSKVSPEDDVYEFEANRWIAKDKEDRQLKVTLIPKSGPPRQRDAVYPSPSPRASAHDRSEKPDRRVRTDSPHFDDLRHPSASRSRAPETSLTKPSRSIHDDSPHFGGSRQPSRASRPESPHLDDLRPPSASRSRPSETSLTKSSRPLHDDSRHPRPLESPPSKSNRASRPESPRLDDLRSPSASRSRPHETSLTKPSRSLLDESPRFADSRHPRPFDSPLAQPSRASRPESPRLDDLRPPSASRSRPPEIPLTKPGRSLLDESPHFVDSRHPRPLAQPSRASRTESPRFDHLNPPSVSRSRPPEAAMSKSGRMTSEPTLRLKSTIDSPSQRKKTDQIYSSAYGTNLKDDF